MPVARPEHRSRIQLCGRLSVELDGRQVADRLRGRQVRALLVLLLLNRRRLVSRQELITALWPATAPVSPDAALRTLLSRVRSALGPGTLGGRDELSLALPEPVWVDYEAAAVELQRAVLALEQRDARTAWAVAQVPLNIAARGLAPGIEATWLDASREELENIRLQALEVVGGAGLMMGGGQLASVERAGRALVEADPFRESGYILLMRAAARRGNPATAVRVFERLRELMRDELGTTPSTEAIALYERVLGSAAPEPAVAEGDQLIAPAPVELPAELQTAMGTELVGRERELSELENRWAVASGRAPSAPGASATLARVMVLAGEAGIGKTSLATKLAQEVHAGGGVVMLGRATEEGLAPYQPFLEALSRYFVSADLDELGVAVHDYGPELARLVPEIRRRVPDLAPAPEAEQEGERYRLFEAVVGLLGAISRRAPILLMLDDLHWADRPTLLLLRHLARATVSRLLIMVAYRAEAPAEGLRDMLDDFERDGLMAQLDVPGLDLASTAELVRIRTGETPSRPLARALQEETEGNPLYIEEIVRGLERAGVSVGTAHASVLDELAVPEGAKRMIERRIELLDPSTVQALRVASVIGRDFDVRLLEKVAGLSEDELLGALEEALTAAVVIEIAAEPGRYSFAHALIQEALYEGMSAARRTRIHGQIGDALEQITGAPVRDLARHYAIAAEAETAEKAVRYTLQAAQDAMAALAHEEAAEHYRRALAVIKRFAPEADERRLEVLLLLGEARVRAGERALVLSVMQEAAELAVRLGDSASLARAAIAASRRYVQQPGVVEDDVVALLTRALDHSEGDVSRDRVRLLARMCGALFYSPQRDRVPALSLEAMTVAEQLGDDPVALAYAFAARRRALWNPVDLGQRVESSTEMLAWATKTPDLELQLQARAFLVVDLLESGDRGAADDQIAGFTGIVARVRQPLYQWNLGVWQAMLAILGGNLKEAEAAAAEALATGAPAEAVTAPMYHEIQRWMIGREQGRMTELEPLIRARVEALPDRPSWQALLAILLMETHRTDEAQRLLDRLSEHEFSDLPRDGEWLLTVALLADLTSGLGDRPRAAGVYELLAPHSALTVVAGLGVVCLGSAARYLGRLAHLLGHREEAGKLLDQALEANTNLKAPLWVAHAQLDYAEVLGAGPRAARLVEDAASTASELELSRVGERAARRRRH